MRTWILALVCVGMAAYVTASPYRRMERRDLAAELDALEEALGMRELATQEDEDETANEEEERELNDQLLGLIEKGVLDPEAVFGRNYGSGAGSLSKKGIRVRVRVRTRKPRVRVRAPRVRI